MADNIGYTPGTGSVVAADEIGGVLHQRIKLGIGEDGTATDLSLTNPMPTQVAARTPTTTSVPSSATSVTILASNANRKGISISNSSTQKLYLSFTSPATTTNAFIEMPAGSFLLLDQQLIISNAIYGIWSSANGTAQITEYV